MLYKKVLSNIFLVFTAVIFCAFPVCAKELKFAVVSDINYANQSATDADSDASKIPTILNAFVERVNENNYDFVVFLGDNIAKSNEKNLEGFLNIVKTVGHFHVGNGRRDFDESVIHRVYYCLFNRCFWFTGDCLHSNMRAIQIVSCAM